MDTHIETALEGIWVLCLRFPLPTLPQPLTQRTQPAFYSKNTIISHPLTICPLSSLLTYHSSSPIHHLPSHPQTIYQFFHPHLLTTHLPPTIHHLPLTSGLTSPFKSEADLGLQGCALRLGIAGGPGGLGGPGLPIGPFSSVEPGV